MAEKGSVLRKKSTQKFSKDKEAAAAFPSPGGKSEKAPLTHSSSDRSKKSTQKLSKGTAPLSLINEKYLLSMSLPEARSPKEELSMEEEERKGILIRKAEVLTRKKDFLHLLWSYQPKSDITYFWALNEVGRHIPQMIQQLRELDAMLPDTNYDIHEERLKNTFQVVERFLSLANSDNWGFIPQEDDIMSSDERHWTQKMEIGVGLTPQTSGDEISEMAIDSAIRQVSKCIEDKEFQKIGISGSGGEKVANALKDTPMIRAKCSVVLCISVSRHHSIEKVRQNIAEQIGTDYISEGSLDRYLPDNFLLLVDCVDGKLDLHDLKIPGDGFLVLTTRFQNVYEIMELDLEIRMEDHLLPWELFCRNVGPSVVNSSSVIQQMAVRLVKECHSHPCAIVLLARALKGVTDIGSWELALHELTSQSSLEQVEGMNQVMVHVLKLIWDQNDITTKRCIKNCTHHRKWRADSLVSDWIRNGLVETEATGKVILEELINSFLLENADNGYRVQMLEETKIVLEKYFIPSLLLRQGGLGLTETPKVEEWINPMEIELMNNKLFELPDNPNCPFLQKLLLDNNYDLMEIPQLFFKDMPVLTHLDLSYTSIKSLPPSISSLVLLRTFYLRGCELLMELPAQIGALENLEDFDLEGTQIMYLPEEIGKLIKLMYFKVSFCGSANRYKETTQRDTTIPTGVLSKLNKMRKLSIDVNPNDDWWDIDVTVILNEVSSLRELNSLELYLPSVELLQQLKWFITKPWIDFGFIIGRHRQRIISRLPQEVEKMFKTWKKKTTWLEYINGEGMPTEITVILKHAIVFFLDRHWTVKMLSEFGIKNMENLEVCLLVECNELQTIIDGDYEYRLGVDKKPVFKWLNYLSIHYMRNLQSIWKGPIGVGGLSNLRCLALHTCPNLTSIFTPDLLRNLNMLEELIVEDCCKIKNLVSQEPSDLKYGGVCLQLERISLLDIPELVNISDVLSISPILKNLIVYNCPKLEILYTMEVSSNNLKIKGEKEWWDALKWHESKSSSSTQPTFEELGSGEDLMDQLAEDMYPHQQYPYYYLQEL